jgi:hypothetical protein
MANYTGHNYRADWQKVKKSSQLPDKLFRQKLGPQLDAIVASHKKMMGYTRDKTKGMVVWKKLDGQVSTASKTVKAYREIVKKNGGDGDALKVLENIDALKKGHMLYDVMLDMGVMTHVHWR